MKKVFLAIMIIGMQLPIFSFFPYFYGARSLALGYSSLAFNYDCNAIYLNPALLSSLKASLTGYQYQSSFLAYQNFENQLAELSAFDLKNFQNLEIGQKKDLLEQLKQIFSAKIGISGFQSKNPCYAGKGYGLAIAFIDSAVVYPLANDILAKPAEQITNSDIASLAIKYLGFHYQDYSFAYSFSLSQEMTMGATVHYLHGKSAEFSTAIVDSPINLDAGAKDHLQFAWSSARKDFSKINLDLAVSADLGLYFKAGLLVKNVANPVITSEIRELRLARRLIVGLAFRPDSQLGITLDIDVAQSDLYFNGKKSQPVSLGVEKGFFQNKMFLRAGFLNDLGEKYFLGRKANILYGLGFGFNLGNFLADFALGLDHMGYVKNLGISGFYLVK